MVATTTLQMPTKRTLEAHQWTQYQNPLQKQGPITAFRECLETQGPRLRCWPSSDNAGHGEVVIVFEGYQDWFTEVAARVKRKDWQPAEFRAIAADHRGAGMLRKRLRAAQLAGRDLSRWHRGEVVRLVSAAGGWPAGTECRILRARTMELADDLGTLHFETPGGQPRTIQAAVGPIPVQAVELQRLDGGGEAALLVDRPGAGAGRDAWHAAVEVIRRRLRNADPATAATIAQLQNRVARIRPCGAIAEEEVGERRFPVIALAPAAGAAFEPELLAGCRELLIAPMEGEW
jgi:hypothetical protein